MAKQTINIGTAANDGSGDPLRDAFDKCNDNFDELYIDVAANSGNISDLDYRRNMAVAATGAPGQVVAYSTTFFDVVPTIFDYNGLGIEVTAHDADGFTITSLTVGDFGYESKNDR